MTLTPADEWGRALADANVRTDDDVTPERLVESVDAPSKVDTEVVCKAAVVAAVKDDRSQVALDDFRSAADQQQPADESASSTDEEATSPPDGVAVDTPPSEAIRSERDTSLTDDIRLPDHVLCMELSSRPYSPAGDYIHT